MTQPQVQSQIKAIKQQIITKYHPDKIILFGSAVEGKMSSDSDLDFLIIKDDSRDPHTRIEDLYRLVKKEIAADFIVYTPNEISERTKKGDPFIKSILSSGKLLYG